MNFKYKVHTNIYHITPESPKGFILDIRYYPRLDIKQYLVAFSYNDELWCTEEELSLTKQLDI